MESRREKGKRESGMESRGVGRKVGERRESRREKGAKKSGMESRRVGRRAKRGGKGSSVVASLWVALTTTVRTSRERSKQLPWVPPETLLAFLQVGTKEVK